MPSRQAQAKRLREERLRRERETEQASTRRRRAGLLAGGLLALAAIAGLLIALAGGGDERDAAVSGSPAPIVDVHGVGVAPADGALYIATHSGLFRSAPGESTARRVEAPEQDLMGFSAARPGRFLASGHPGPSQQGLPNPLGLIESRDGGRSWRSISLEGEADFHVLRAAGDVVYAFDGRLMASRDGGASWKELKPPGELSDLAPDPRSPGHVLASTNDGLKLSSDGGRRWSNGTLAGPALLAWGRGARVFAVDGAGKVSASANAGRSWKAVGAVQGPPAAFVADRKGRVYVARQDGSVDQSSDGGRTWRPRSRN